jgi:hypothetical protein
MNSFSQRAVHARMGLLRLEGHLFIEHERSDLQAPGSARQRHDRFCRVDAIGSIRKRFYRRGNGTMFEQHQKSSRSSKAVHQVGGSISSQHYIDAIVLLAGYCFELRRIFRISIYTFDIRRRPSGRSVLPLKSIGLILYSQIIDLLIRFFKFESVPNGPKNVIKRWAAIR